MTNEELVARIQAGIDEADNMLSLWQQNKGLIHTIARKYAAYEEMEDLEQQGYLGLCDAVRCYEPEEGANFCTYAVIWIKQSLQRYIDDCSTVVRIPSGRRQEITRYRRACAAFERGYGRKPTDREISSLLGVSPGTVGRIKGAAQMGSTASLDTPLNEDGEETIGDLQPGAEDVENSVLDDVQQEQLKAVIWPLVDALPGKQPTVIRMRYQEGLTLQECGDKLWLTLQGARTQEAKAFRELRKPSRARQLKPFLDEYIYDRALQGNGVGTFNHTWTSSTERVAMKLVER